MIRRRLWSSAPGSARYFLTLGDGWLDEWVTAVFGCGWVDGERGTKKTIDVKHHGTTASSTPFLGELPTWDRDTRRLLLQPIQRHQSTYRTAGEPGARKRQPTTASHRDVNDRNSGELWFSSACSGQLRRPKHSFQRRRPTRNSSQELRNQSKNYASRSRAWRWANTAVLTETPSSSSILHLSYKPELSYSCLLKINLLFSLLLLEYSTRRW